MRTYATAKWADGKSQHAGNERAIRRAVNGAGSPGGSKGGGSHPSPAPVYDTG